MTTPEALARAKSARLVAPAGYGKTHLIGDAVADHADGKQLLLTHTNAGVRAIRDHLRRRGCSSAHEVETISGWSRHLVASYPRLSGVDDPDPVDESTWRKVYLGAARALTSEAIRQVVRVSYSGLYVDEYQDCTSGQHRVISALAELVPCRVLGDPLQCIFDFQKEDVVVDWESDVCSTFSEELDSLTTPHRWLEANESLGYWLRDVVRHKLENGEPIDLRSRPDGVQWNRLESKRPLPSQISVCQFALKLEGTVVGIHGGISDHHCQQLAGKLGGTFQCMETAECPELLQACKVIEELTGKKRSEALLAFASRCLTRFRAELGRIQDHFADKKPFVKRPRRHSLIFDALQRVSETESLDPVREALALISETDGLRLQRRELFRSLEQALVAYAEGEHESLADAARHCRNIVRRAGRRTDRRSISRTLLIKGLQFDHAIVLDADTLDCTELYVALTRAKHSLTILSSEPILRPARRSKPGSTRVVEDGQMGLFSATTRSL